jgi:hypothetical protein
MESIALKCAKLEEKYIERLKDDEHYDIENTFGEDNGKYTEYIKSLYNKELRERITSRMKI